MSDAIRIGTVPTGSVVIRKATIKDLRDDPARVALIETPDGRQYWLNYPQAEDFVKRMSAKRH